jgi:hypothetical protein
MSEQNITNFLEHLDKIKSELEGSPIYNASLASKELFHSNLWDWIIKSAATRELQTKAVQIFLGDAFSDRENEIKTYREKNNLDLVIECDGKRYVIENKIKSIPDRTQLIKYSKGNKSDDGTQWLLATVIKPHFRLPVDWGTEPLYYNKIAERINEYLKNQVIDTYHRQLLGDYAMVLRNLYELICYDTDSEKYDFYPSKISNPVEHNHIVVLNELRIADVYIKSRNTAFYQYLHNKVEQEYCHRFEELKFENLFTNKSGGVTIRYCQKEQFEIGIQIQHLQYRYFVILYDGGNCVNEDGSINESIRNPIYSFIDEGWFYKKPSESFRNQGHACGMRKQFCKYESSARKNIFIYQYRNINHGEPFSEISKCVVRDLARAKTIFDKRCSKEKA